MKITIRMTRAENVAEFGAQTVSMDIEEYLCGVVPAEIYESADREALKAQAVAARTFAVKRAMASVIMDDTTSFQAYRYGLSRSSPRSRQAVMDTAGQVLCYGGEIIDCFYSASNGGQTKRSGDVWQRHYPYYLNKTDEWDIAARREKPANAGHGVGMSQVGAMWAAKNGIPYNQILAFYYHGTAIVSEYGTGGVVGFEDTTEGGILMNLTTRYMTRNDCYTANRKIVPKGIMVHSTATPGVMAAAWFSRWNKSYKAGETDRQVCVHAFLDDKEIWQYLPWDHRGWHAGGSANDSYIGFEICEPAGFTYSGGATMVGYDAAKHEAYFRAAWANAVALCVYLCKLYGLTEQNIICHSEGYKLGIASNHADVLHWFPKHGENMDTFRAAVKAALAGGSSGDGTETGGYYRVRKSWSDAASQLGAFKVLSNAKALADKSPGYSVFDEKGNRVYPASSDTPSGDFAVGDLVAFKTGTANYYPGSVKVPSWVISDYHHRITQITSGGKPVTKGGKACVLLGKKIRKSGGSEEAGINTWVDKDVLSKVGGDQTGEAYTTYTVAKGDSLWGIAKAKLGSGARYPEIMSLNGLSSTTIYPGQVLKIPK
jgi:N-acetylmuramoyl-L-alanine amidase